MHQAASPSHHDPSLGGQRIVPTLPGEPRIDSFSARVLPFFARAIRLASRGFPGGHMAKNENVCLPADTLQTDEHHASIRPDSMGRSKALGKQARISSEP